MLTYLMVAAVCQMSAAAFAKGLLDLETPKVNNEAAALTPILASLVIKDAKMLDFITQEARRCLAVRRRPPRRLHH